VSLTPQALKGGVKKCGRGRKKTTGGEEKREKRGTFPGGSQTDEVVNQGGLNPWGGKKRESKAPLAAACVKAKQGKAGKAQGIREWGKKRRQQRPFNLQAKCVGRRTKPGNGVPRRKTEDNIRSRSCSRQGYGVPVKRGGKKDRFASWDRGGGGGGAGRLQGEGIKEGGSDPYRSAPHTDCLIFNMGRTKTMA